MPLTDGAHGSAVQQALAAARLQRRALEARDGVAHVEVDDGLQLVGGATQLARGGGQLAARRVVLDLCLHAIQQRSMFDLLFVFCPQWHGAQLKRGRSICSPHRIIQPEGTANRVAMLCRARPLARAEVLAQQEWLNQARTQVMEATIGRTTSNAKVVCRTCWLISAGSRATKTLPNLSAAAQVS